MKPRQLLAGVGAFSASTPAAAAPAPSRLVLLGATGRLVGRDLMVV